MPPVPVKATSLPFREQAEFFRRKLNIPTEAWTDIYAQEHDWAFMVAGANRDDIVADFRQAVERVIADGGTIDSFRNDFDSIVQRHGWSYNGGRNWRSRVIYDTNLNQSYNAGRYEQLLAVRETRPYWMYLHSDAVENPRPLHESWSNLVLRWDDPWWQTHFPSNGWGCQCRVVAISESELRAMGKTGPDNAPPVEWEQRIIGQRSPGGPFTVTVPRGVDPGFEYAPGRGRLNNATPPATPSNLPPGGKSPAQPAPSKPTLAQAMPAPRRANMNVLPDGLSPQEYANIFLAEFGATLDTPVNFTDVAGNHLAIGSDLFRDADGDLVAPGGRYLQLLAQALKLPQEIWARTEFDSTTGRATVRRSYLARLDTPGGVVDAAVDFGRGGWNTSLDADTWRVGTLIYRAEE